MSQSPTMIRVDQLPPGPSLHQLTWAHDQLGDLAQKLGLAGLQRLEAHLELASVSDGLSVTGQITAELQYLCRVSCEAFAARIEEPLNILFLSDMRAAELAGPEAAALSLDPVERLPLAGPELDLQALVIETFSLALDPFPRGPKADIALKQLGILSEEEARQAASPFAVLRNPGQKAE